MSAAFMLIDQNDTAVVALQNLPQGTSLSIAGKNISLKNNIQVKHKFALIDFKKGDKIHMYGVIVGKALQDIAQGESLTCNNMAHDIDEMDDKTEKAQWAPLPCHNFKHQSFIGYHRSDGKVGTANYWLVVPLVFCENRNIEELQHAFLKPLGYQSRGRYENAVRELIQAYKNGQSQQDLEKYSFGNYELQQPTSPLFPNVEGIRFLQHETGCGGTRLDSDSLCDLLAGYITHPNVAGATILSLGCQHAQISIIQDRIHKRSPNFEKPLFIFEQQAYPSEKVMMEDAIRKTFSGLVHANQCKREPASLDQLCIGVECGGSDGFSGISANPAIGHVSDMIVSLGGSAILSEFPELCGVESDILKRAITPEVAKDFKRIITDYEKIANALDARFDMNPSPGNIKDGLITDAMKSAGAAKKGGRSPVVAVHEYPGHVQKKGLNLICTAGNDVESTTALTAAGANLILFSTGLGTPTGNPICPVIKISSNTKLYRELNDIIDVDAGLIIEGKKTIAEVGEDILNLGLKIASGHIKSKAMLLGQYDFIPWKRGISL